MNLVVCLKRVPDSSARLRVAPDGRSVSPEGVDTIISPYDEYAIEEALKLRETHGGQVTGVCVDPEGNDTALRKALAMGVDQGILVAGGDPFDGAAVAEILAGVLKTLTFDLVLFGKQAIDSDSAMVPPMVAHRLGLPRATVVNKITPGTGSVTVHRQIEGAEEVLELPLPCLLSTQKGLNEPRFPSLKGIMAARKKPLERREAPPVARRLELLKMEPPPARPAGRIVGEGPGAVKDLLSLLRNEAKVI